MFNRDCGYISCFLEDVAVYYNDVIRIPLVLLICLFGALSNVANIIVFTRKQLRTPLNALFTALSIAQMLMATNFIVLTIFEFFQENCEQMIWTHTGAMIQLIGNYLGTTLCFAAFAHIVMVAVLFYVGQKASWYIDSKWLVISSITIYVVAFLIKIDQVFKLEVRPVNYSQFYGYNCSLESQYDFHYAYDRYPYAYHLTFTIANLCIEFISFLSLIACIIGLLCLRKSVGTCAIEIAESQTSIAGDDVHLISRIKLQTTDLKGRQRIHKQRTTQLVILMLLVCLVVESFYWAIGMFSHMLAHLNFAQGLHNFMMMLIILCNSINIAWYYLMLDDFRQMFLKLFCPCAKTHVTEYEQLETV